MILYRCACGAKLLVEENTERSRREKRAWKKKHDEKNGGHKWMRLTLKGRKV